MSDPLDSTVSILKQCFTPSELSSIAERIVPAAPPKPSLYWVMNQYNILESGRAYALGAYSGGLCIICGAVVPTREASRHAGWHNDLAARP